MVPMLMTTTPIIQGKNIRHYRGIVTGEAIVGANIFKDFFAGIRDIFGGRSAAYEAELGRARELALQEMADAALPRGSNEVVASTTKSSDKAAACSSYAPAAPPSASIEAWHRLGSHSRCVFAICSAAPLAAQNLPDWTPPAWIQGSWGLSERGAVVSVVAAPGNVAVTMTVDGTQVVFDGVDTASGGAWRVKGSTGCRMPVFATTK